MNDETKEKIFIMLVGLATIFAICGSAGIGYIGIYGFRTLFASIPFWILSGILYLTAYVFIKKIMINPGGME